MKMTANSLVSELLFWSYANLAMAEKAVHERDSKYARVHYMIRARLFSGMKKGTMSARSLVRDQRIRMRLPQACIYCGGVEHLAIDHVMPMNRGGADVGDHAVWACRRCHSSKSDRVLLVWWFNTQEGFPPLFVVRIYLKQAIEYFTVTGLMIEVIRGIRGRHFLLESIPTRYPPPGKLRFSPFHARGGSVSES